MKHLFDSITHIIFDLDGLLIDSEPLWKAAETNLLQQHGRQWDEQFGKQQTGLRQDEASALMTSFYDLPISAEEAEEKVLQQMLQWLNDRLHPMPGASELLRGLDDAGYPMAIASSSRLGYIHKVIETLGWSEMIHVTASGYEVVHGKPAPDVYQLAARRLGVHPEHCMAFEDSLNGTKSARAAGLRVVSVPGERFDLADFDGIADYVSLSLKDVLPHIPTL